MKKGIEIMTEKDTFEMKAFLLINLFISEFVASYKLYYNLDDQAFLAQFMLVIFICIIILWNSMKIHKDKQRYIYANLIFLILNIIGIIITIVGDESFPAFILFIIGCIIGAASLIFLYRKYRLGK